MEEDLHFQSEVEELVACSEGAAKKMKMEILLMQQEIMKDHRLHTEAFAKSAALFTKMVDAGQVRTFRELNTGKGMYDSHVYTVELTHAEPDELAAMLKEYCLSRVPLSIKGCAWRINFKLDQFCTGDVLREAHAVIDYMYKAFKAGEVNGLSSNCF